MATYPAAVFAPRTIENKTGVVYDAAKTTTAYAEDQTLPNAEIVAIETELGTTPKGTKADVKTRLNDVDTLLGDHSARHENGGADEISVAGLSGVLADDQSANNVNLAAAPSADSVSGVKITLVAHATVAKGDVCFINSDGEAALGDADAIASASVVVMAAAAISANDPGVFLVLGVAHLHTLNPGWTVGGLVYLSVTGTTGNTLTQSAPSGADDVIQILGVALAADILLFKPQLVQVEHT